MKTTVIEVQEVETQLEISYLHIQLDPKRTYKAKDQNGNKFSFRTIKHPNHLATYMVFENGKIRINRPVKIVENEG